MAVSNESKSDLMYQFFVQHNFDMDGNVADKLKCGECKTLLINPHIGPCLCKFCRHCIDNMLANGIDKCPGNRDGCKEERISQFLSDFITRSKISKLVLKCPNELCEYKCELVKMEEHYRLCSSKCVKCPFFGLGCENDKLAEDKMSDHLQLEGYNHNKILIEMNEILRNEVNLLKGNDEKNRNQIEILKDEIIAINEKIQKNKHQTEDILTENARIKDDIITIKEEKQHMEAEINNLKMESENEITNLREQMTKEWRDELRTEVAKIKDEMEKMHLELTSRTEGVEKRQCRPIEAVFSWRVDQISKRIQKYTNNFIEIFYLKTNQYKMQLGMGNRTGRDELKILFNIYAGENDELLEWPFQRNVSVKISNPARSEASKTITKQCKVPKPDNNSYNPSDPFEFSFTELSTTGLMQGDCFVIEFYFE